MSLAVCDIGAALPLINSWIFDMKNDNEKAYGHHERKQMQKFVPKSAQRLLDVGCNAGNFGAGIKAERQIEVWGVEPDLVASEHAAKLLDHVVNDFFTASTAVPDDYFDAIIFNDVLEHLVDPWEGLRIATRKLRPGGCVIASIPNILHQSNLRHMLVEKDFRYELNGIRDRTHLRFFTRLSTIRLFEESGYEPLQVEGINEEWWTPSWKRRLAYRIFSKALEETKYIQYAIVARPTAVAA